MTPIGCGGSAPEPTVGRSDSNVAPARPVELALKRSDGTFLDVGDYRGQPVLLFVFATFDGLSQAELGPLSGFVRAHPEVLVIGIAAQPDAQPIVQAFESAMNLPFVIAYDPEESVTAGTSSLGRIEFVPSFFLLDERGVVASKRAGFATQTEIEALLGHLSQQTSLSH